MAIFLVFLVFLGFVNEWIERTAVHGLFCGREIKTNRMLTVKRATGFFPGFNLDWYQRPFGQNVSENTGIRPKFIVMQYA